MTRLSTILAATDLSAPSRHAVFRAALLAKEAGAKLELLHVVERHALETLRATLARDTGDIGEKLHAHAQQALQDLAGQVLARYGVAPGVHVAEGAVLAEIITRADVIGGDLLVFGARGASFVRHWVLGATAERLLRKTVRPILVVKQVAHEAYRQVLVPVDFSPWSASALRLARSVAPTAEITLMHAYEVPFEGKLRFAGVDDEVIHRYRIGARDEALKKLHLCAAQSGLSVGNYRAVAVHGDAAPRILEQEEEEGADLLVVGKHGLGMTEELLLGSVTKHVIAEARCDVLVGQR
jgi:nucleotide-binding universal stress UspA family protein